MEPLLGLTAEIPVQAHEAAEKAITQIDATTAKAVPRNAIHQFRTCAPSRPSPISGGFRALFLTDPEAK
jgi:hypothetical protein